MIGAVTNARVLGFDEPVAVALAGDRIAAIGAPSELCHHPPVFDAAGRSVVPGFVDAHVHLDKAYQLDALMASGASLASLDDALAGTALLRKSMTTSERIAGAERLLGRMVRHGTVAARVHVELDPDEGLDAVEWHVALARAWSDRITLQLVAFPQHGLFHDPRLPGLLEDAMAAGCHVVGACPYMDDDPRRHIAHVVDLASRLRAPLDLHIDFTDDPHVHDADLLVDVLRAGHEIPSVAIGHVTSLAAMEPGEVDRRADALAEAGVALISLPATDLFLGGRGVERAQPRAVAPLRRLIDRGVTVAIATNNVCNGFTPYGDGSLTQIAWLAGLVGHFPPGDGHAQLLDAITRAPASILGLSDHGLMPGGRADLVVIDAPDPLLAVAGPAPVTAVIRGGVLTAGREVPLGDQAVDADDPVHDL